MPVRTRKGRLHVVSSPQSAAEGRRAGVAPVERSRMPNVQSAADGAIGLALALQAHAAATDPGERDRLGRRVRGARARLRGLAGPEVASAIERALRVDCGRALAIDGQCPEDMRRSALASAVSHAAIVAEHDVRSTAGMLGLALAARHHAVAHVALDVVHREGIGATQAVSAARLCSVEWRLALESALRLERQARDAGASASAPQAIDVDAVIAARQAAAWANYVPPDDESDDEPESGEPEADEPEEPTT